MKLPPELSEQWKNHARNNPGRSYSSAEFGQINRQFRDQKQSDDRKAALERRDLELYQRKWEELSGGYTQAPEYIPSRDNPNGGRVAHGNHTEQFLQSRVAELKRHQNRMSRNQQKQQQQRQQMDNAGGWQQQQRQLMDNAGGWSNPNKQNNTSPSMQNPFQF